MSLDMGDIVVEYHKNLEDALAWILGAEEHVQESDEDDLMTSDVDTVKILFHAYDGFMADLREYQNQVSDLLNEGKLLIESRVCSTEEEQEIGQQKELLNDRWEALRSKATDKQNHLHEVLMLLQKKQLDNLRAWLITAEDKISKFCELGEDLPSVIQQCKDHRQFQEEVGQQEAIVKSLSNVVVIVDDLENGNELRDGSSDDLEDQLTALGEKWAHVCRFVEERSALLELVAKNWQLLDEEEVKFNHWISSLDERLAVMEDSAKEAESGSKVINDLTKRLQKLEKEMEDQHVHYSQIADDCQDMLEHIDKNSSVAIAISEKFENITDTWDTTVQRMEELGHALYKAAQAKPAKKSPNSKSSVQKYQEFKKLLTAEMDWLDRLEKKLKKSPQAAVDAEEISETLDDLENYMHNRPVNRMEEMKILRDELVKDNVMGDTVTSDVERVETRWSMLSRQSKKRQNELESIMCEAQHCETQVLNMQSWLSRFDLLLQKRLDSDTLAEDVPDEVEQLDTEVKENADLLQHLESCVGMYEQQERSEAAARLKEQVDLIKYRLAAVQGKFKQYKCPSDLEPKLQRILRTLETCEASIEAIKLNSHELTALEKVILDSRKIGDRLKETEPDVKWLTDEAEEIREYSHQRLEKLVDQVKQKYSQVLQIYVDKENVLEKALAYAEDIQVNMYELKGWLNEQENPAKVSKRKLRESRARLSILEENFNALKEILPESDFKLLAENIDILKSDLDLLEEKRDVTETIQDDMFKLKKWLSEQDDPEKVNKQKLDEAKARILELEENFFAPKDTSDSEIKLEAENEAIPQSDGDSLEEKEEEEEEEKEEEEPAKPSQIENIKKRGAVELESGKVHSSKSAKVASEDSESGAGSPIYSRLLTTAALSPDHVHKSLSSDRLASPTVSEFASKAEHHRFKMTELMDALKQFNDVVYSAYRTALKIRTVQQCLRLDLLHLESLINIFDQHGLRAQNDKLINVSEMISCLESVYKSLSNEHASQVNVPVCIDQGLNWLVNVYDSSPPTGYIRVLSFKIGLATLSRASLDEKYRYMFRLIADTKGAADEQKLGLLLSDLVQIPRLLGEIASFGGSNVEPSVRSCFERDGQIRTEIESMDFLSWLDREPQCIVWLPVLHRLIAAENATHSAKCNICKQFPIVGFRYRCLKCFSFDICQCCFFAQRTAGKHKLTHPIQEYCVETKSGEDVRDFTKIIKNKFKSKRYFEKNPRVGYLPVQPEF
ncbi:Dystrophin, isoform E [Halotydeus destructor]|nr:Dystrophin, isoform E [Halotydeus destructor]